MGFSKSCAVLGALVLVSCGSPAELDEQSFPELNETGYNSSSNPTGGGAAGSGNTTNVVNGGAGSGSVGGAGSGGLGSAGAGGVAAGGCPPDASVLFNRPSAQGGCTQGGGCHEASSPFKPDLVSPGVATRLLNVASSCGTMSNGMSVQPRPYISATDSFLEEKIAGANPGCGVPMPFFMDYALTPSDEQCILNWIDQVIAGGG